jgi:hypothetical protein
VQASAKLVLTLAWKLAGVFWSVVIVPGVADAQHVRPLPLSVTASVRPRRRQ